MITIDTLSAIADAVQEEIRKIPDSDSKGDEISIGADVTPTAMIDKIAEKKEKERGRDARSF